MLQYVHHEMVSFLEYMDNCQRTHDVIWSFVSQKKFQIGLSGRFIIVEGRGQG